MAEAILMGMAQSFRVTIDVAYHQISPPVTAPEIRAQLLMDLDSANFPGLIDGFSLKVAPLEDDEALRRSLAIPKRGD